jgi:mono/diheme cytochrome c family protein
MKKYSSILLIAFATVTVAAAQDAAAIYKSKCLSCHGPKGAGKPAMKGSNLLSDEAKKASDEALTDAILHGGAAKKASHSYGSKGITADQAKALVAYIRTLQK